MNTPIDTRKFEHDELKLLYQASVADLSYFKQQQWSIAYYALLLYAAVCTTVKLLPTPRSWELGVLGALVIAIAVAASGVLWKHEAAIGVRRYG